MRLNDTARLTFLVRHVAYVVEDGEGGPQTQFVVVRSCDGKAIGRGESAQVAIDAAITGDVQPDAGERPVTSASRVKQRRLGLYLLMALAIGAFATSSFGQQRIRDLAQHVNDIGLSIAAIFDEATAPLARH